MPLRSAVPIRPALCAALLMLCLVPLSAQQLILGPYVQLGCAGQVVLCWETDLPAPAYLMGQRGSEHFELRVAEPRKRHELRIEGIPLAEELRYAIGASPEKLYPGGSGRTQPWPGRELPVALRFAALGDVGTGKPAQRQVAQVLQGLHRAEPLDFWIPLGDNAYLLGKDREYRRNFFPFYDTLMRALPTLPIPGNHEYYSPGAKPYYDLFHLPQQGECGGTPSGSERYYSVDIGPLHLVLLNSEEKELLQDSSAMLRWLHQDLGQTSAKWKVVCWHQPAYTKGSHDSDNPRDMNSARTREVLVPVMDRYSVDLVLHGHSHSYERSTLVKGHYGPSSSYRSELMRYTDQPGSRSQPYRKLLPNSPGTLYCVTGNGGKLSPGHSLNHPVMVVNQDTAEGLLLVEIRGDSLLAQHISRSGARVDEFCLVKPYPTQQAQGNAIREMNVTRNANGDWQFTYQQQRPGQPQLTIYDLRGRRRYPSPRLLYAEAYGRYTFSVPAKGMPPGGYLLRTEVEGLADYFPIRLR